ncbi:21 kDa protein [Beta vulgaris subsp. vulgaris]|nr:21 kDa protein [Beta vulgaris subsp. vulgaris]
MMKRLYSPTHCIAFFSMLCITSQISPILATQRPTTITPTYTDFLKTSCKATLYPELCYNSLSTYTNVIQTSPEKLANAALSVTLTTTRTTTDMISRMSNGPGIRPSEAGALRDCLEELNDAIYELQESIMEMFHIKGSKKLGLKINNIQTWVSAALTDEDTCMDGSSGGEAMDGKLKSVVRGRIVNICHLTSNSLALINDYASSMLN